MELLISDDAQIGVYSATKGFKDVAKQAPNTAFKKPETTGEIAPWYDADNLYPQSVIAAVKSNDVLSAALGKKRDFLIANGLCYGKRTREKSGNYLYECEDNEEINTFLEDSNIRRYIAEAAGDLIILGNAFVEIVLSPDRSKIVSLAVQSAKNCRWSKQDEKTGRYNYVYLNADWANVTSVTDSRVIKYPAIDPYFKSAESLRLRNDGFRYIYPLHDDTPGSELYQEPFWQPVLRNNWLKLAQLIPNFKVAALENQFDVKYHIKVPSGYWQSAFQDWTDKTPEQKQAKKEEFYKKLADSLTGVEKSGSTIFTEFSYDQHLGKEFNDWKIELLDKAKIDGKYIEDSQEASTHLLMATGVDPTIMGTIPGKNNNSTGSGSDKRVAINILQISMTPIAESICEVLDFVAKYNGWKARFWLHREQVVTTDNIKPSERL